MSTKLYVGNLNFKMTNQDLQELFEQVGSVDSATVISDRDTGRSRGFGFVEMASAEDAEKAIAEFNGKEIDGRRLVVNEARPREGGRDGGSKGGRSRGRDFDNFRDRGSRW